jgi:hypothetical protein
METVKLDQTFNLNRGAEAIDGYSSSTASAQRILARMVAVDRYILVSPRVFTMNSRSPGCYVPVFYARQVELYSFVRVRCQNRSRMCNVRTVL